MYIKIPRKIAHIINPEPAKKESFPQTYCGLSVFAHGQYFKESHSGKVCPECEQIRRSHGQ